MSYYPNAASDPNADVHEHGYRGHHHHGENGVRRFVEENPLLTIGLAFAGGLIAGALLPTSQVERQRVGRQVRAAGHRVADTVRHGAEDAMSAARHASSDIRRHAEDGLHRAEHAVESGIDRVVDGVEHAVDSRRGNGGHGSGPVL